MVNTILKAVGASAPALATASGPNPTPPASVSCSWHSLHFKLHFKLALDPPTSWNQIKSCTMLQTYH